MPQRLFTSAQAVVDTAAFGLDIGKAQLDPRPDLLIGTTQKCLLEQGAGPTVATGFTLYQCATMKLGGRQHSIMMP